MIITGVGLTVVLVLIVGVVVARKVDGDSANYLVAGRSLSLPLVAVALTTAAVDSNATVGNTDLSATFGFWAGASLALGLAICLLLAGLFLAAPMNRMGLFTLGDFFHRRYDRKVEVTASALMVFAFTILLAGNMVACGFLFEYFSALPFEAGAIISVLLVLLYTIGGGLYSDAYTAVIQAAITVAATLALLLWTATKWGISIPDGMGPFAFEQLTDSSMGAPINWATLISLGIGDLVAIDFMQRIFGARSPETARRACFVGAGFTAAIGTVWALIALTATDVLGLTTENGPIMFQLLDGQAPTLLAVLVLSGVVAASFSTASGAILATSAVVVRNIAGVKREVAPGHYDPLLRWTRLAMLPVILVGVLLALRVSQTGILLTLAFDLMLACLLVPFIAGLFWRRATVTAAMVAIGVGFAVRMVLLVLTPTLYGVPNDLLYVDNSLLGAGFDGWATMVAFAASVLAFVATALMTGHSPDEETDLVQGSVTDAAPAATAPADPVAPVPSPGSRVPAPAQSSGS